MTGEEITLTLQIITLVCLVFAGVCLIFTTKKLREVKRINKKRNDG